MRRTDERARCNGERGRCSAFTLVELLVVVAIISILLALMLPNISGQIERARRVACRNGMKNQALAYMIDADDRDGRVQIERWIGGAWMWDIDFDTRKRLVEHHGLSRHTLYCPSNQDQNDDELWNFGGFCVTGYWLLIERANPSGSSHPPFRTIPNDPFRPGLVGRLSDAGSTSVMIADATISSGGSFTHIYGGWRMPHRSPHLDIDGRRPAGGNVLFADGHAVWREYGEMRSRLNMGPEHWW